MDDRVAPIDPQLHKSAVLICIALELKFGTTDQLLTLAAEQGDLSEEKIKI